MDIENDNAGAKEFCQGDCPFAAGEVISQSGLYEICHHDEPRTRVILTINAIFPFCRTCGEKVRYRLVQDVPHISEDPDFNEFLVEPNSPTTGNAAPKSVLPMQLGQAYGFRFWQETLST
jgi:hypothetical protein